MFIEDIIVLIKCYWIFLIILSVVIKRSKGGGIHLVAKPIFRARNSIIIL